MSGVDIVGGVWPFDERGLADGHRSAGEFEGGGAGAAAVGDELKKSGGWLATGQFAPS